MLDWLHGMTPYLKTLFTSLTILAGILREKKLDELGLVYSVLLHPAYLFDIALTDYSCFQDMIFGRGKHYLMENRFRSSSKTFFALKSAESYSTFIEYLR